MKNPNGSNIADGLLHEGLITLERRCKLWDLNNIHTNGNLLFEVEKGTYSGFTDSGGQPTALYVLLNALGIRPGDELYIAGLHTNGGVKYTAADAWFRGFRPVLISDCTASFDDVDGKMGMDHACALAYAKFWYQAGVLTSDEVVKEIQSLRKPVQIA